MNCLLLTTIVTLVAIQATSADTDFEEFLSSLNYEAPDQLSRVARHAGGGGKFKICCGKRDTITFTEEETAAAKKCKGAHGGGDKKEMFKCMADCVGKEIGIVDSDGNVNLEKFMEKMKSMYDETELKEKVESIAPAIVERANAEKGNGECSSAPMRSYMIIGHEIEKTCPEHLKNNSEDCEKKREWMQKKNKERHQ